MTEVWPNSPRQLLEARYKAFVDGNIDFIIESHHSSTRDQLDRNSLETWSKRSKWLGLTIEEEKPGDDKTYITFTVRHEKELETINHREFAEFRKEEGRWYYFDSEFPKPESIRRDSPKVGRNDPCPCGSEKKYKKCHGLG